MSIELPPQYDPRSVEKPIYQKWLDAKVFHAVPDGRPPEQRFSVVIPPPNVTGALHLGHAINCTIQDILTRYHRMKGDNTLWMPGIDHAGIATQAVVEKTIFEKEKKSRHDLGRDELVRRIWEWKEQFGTRILSQLASIGSSCDWDRTRFTLDEICAKAVREAFFKMFKDGLIFRGKRLVNWDTHLQTAVADDEIYHETVKGQLTSIKYPVDGSPDEYLVVATTRPETMLGDTAVAVHPDDPRYKHLIGGQVIVPLVGRKIPIIADGLLVDPKFGTGVVKVTPAHDPNDYATGQRHNLEQINLLTPDGKVNEKGQGEFQGKAYSYVGLKFATAARKQVLADLEALGLIAEAKPHEHEVGHSDRSKTPIEPYLSDQWFVRLDDLETTPASETRPSGSVAPQGTSTGRPHSDAIAYFITFHTYATWLHGEEEGSVDPNHNTPDAPFIPPDPDLIARDARNLKDPPLQLTPAQRKIVHRTLHEVAVHRGWKIHAANVRSTHVHVVVSGNHAPERMMNDFKSYATRRMSEAGLLPSEAKVWSRHGSTRYLWKSEHLSGAVQYTLGQQGENLPGTFSTGPVASGIGSRQTLPHGRVSDAHFGSDAGSPEIAASETRPSGSVAPQGKPGITLANGARATGLAQAAMDAVLDGRVKITPERYAKGYLDWLGQKRDWCISRQLWWGHRIPVWTITLDFTETEASSVEQIWLHRRQVMNKVEATLAKFFTAYGVRQSIHWIPDLNSMHIRICSRGEDADRAIHMMGELHRAFTLEKVEPGKPMKIEAMPEFPSDEAKESALDIYSQILQPAVQDPDVLDTWFSSALWPISTMGWPNSGTSEKPDDQLLPYFYPTSVLSTAREILTLWVARMVMFGLYCHGDVPFKSVYIHAVIQDGEGRPMKKSLGNGVDPVDIVNSHGADALRFTLASMATETQDIRMPVAKDPKTGNNTSPKFDIGRNFANKIWNASRFILSMPRAEGESAGLPLAQGEIADRWIMSRLNATVAAVHKAINGYHFADYAQAVYQFFWSDLCDWYLEIAKARIKANEPTVQNVLRHCLATSLQLLHPLMPFITEHLWSYLAPGKGLLAMHTFPLVHESLADAAAESQMELVQSITKAIREIQNRYPAARGKPVILQPKEAATQQTIDKSRGTIESLASTTISENSPTAAKPENAATAVIEGVQVFIGGVIDKAAESAKLARRKAELEKLILGSRNKLGNEAFVSKAPAHIIQGLRDQLAKLEEELRAIEQNLAELGA